MRSTARGTELKPRKRAAWSALALCLTPAWVMAGPCRMPGPAPKDAVIASWYGHEHHGQVMAGGGRFDEAALTAAHPYLPLHSLILVTNLINGRTVHVHVTDRGPGHGRGLDLSRRAAELIGLERCGVGPVRISVEPQATLVPGGALHTASMTNLYHPAFHSMEFLWPRRPNSRCVQQ
jgi:rare lipoprotein A (peptidoglycan hydrolase)